MYAVLGCAGCLRLTGAPNWYNWMGSPNLRHTMSVALFAEPRATPSLERLRRSTFKSVEEVAESDDSFK